MQSLRLPQVGYIFRNGTEVAVVAYLDCIHDRVSIIFIVFIGRVRNAKNRSLRINLPISLTY